MSDPFQEHVLHSSQVCSNCYRRIRRRAPTPPVDRTSREGLFSGATRRNRETTTAEHVPDDPPGDDHRTFCQCGVESAFDRARSKWRVDPVREYAKRVSKTLADLDVDHDRKTFFVLAIEYHEGDADWRTDDLLATALDQAIAVAASRSTRASAD